jgi:hypothetical protein
MALTAFAGEEAPAEFAFAARSTCAVTALDVSGFPL